MMVHSPIKLRHLVAFQEVARRGRLQAAAEALSITQPGMSKTIRELETSLGVPLFERLPDGMRLTPAGRTLLRYAAPALRSLEEGIEAVRQGAPDRVIRLGALSNVEGGLLPVVLTELYRAAPQLRVEVDTGTSAGLLARLRLGELDLVVGRMSEAAEIRDLRFEHLYYEPLVAVVRRGHPLLDGAPSPALGDGHYPWDEYPWIVPPRATTLRESLERYWVEQGSEAPPIALETLSLPLSRAYLLGSDAVWVTPMDTAHEGLTSGDMVCLTCRIEVRGGSVGFAVNASQPQSSAALLFCERLRHVAQRYAMSL